MAEAPMPVKMTRPDGSVYWRGKDPVTGKTIRGTSSRGGRKEREKRELACTYACCAHLGLTYLWEVVMYAHL